MLEITNTTITSINRLITDVNWNKNYTDVVATNVKCYKYKWSYEDFQSFEEFQNGQENWKFIIMKEETFDVKDNDLITIWTDKYLIKNAVLVNPDDEFYSFFQCMTFKNNN